MVFQNNFGEIEVYVSSENGQCLSREVDNFQITFVSPWAKMLENARKENNRLEIWEIFSSSWRQIQSYVFLDSTSLDSTFHSSPTAFTIFHTTLAAANYEIIRSYAIK